MEENVLTLVLDDRIEHDQDNQSGESTLGMADRRRCDGYGPKRLPVYGCSQGHGRLGRTKIFEPGENAETELSVSCRCSHSDE